MNLLKMDILSNVGCPYCQSAVKNCYHVFCGSGTLNIQKVLVFSVHCPPVLSFLETAICYVDVVWELMQLDFTLVPIFVTILWGVCKLRNLNLFQNSTYLLQDIVAACLVYVESYTAVKQHQLIVHKELVLSWKPPTQVMVKLNFDGALFQYSNSAGIGSIL